MVSKSADPLTRDRGFESGSLQRRVVQTIGSAWKAFSERDSEFESDFLHRQVRCKPILARGLYNNLERRGSSGRLTGRQAQTRQVKLAVLGIAQVHDIGRHHGRGDGAQPLDGMPRLFEPAHTGVASSEVTTRYREVRGLLEREEQLWDRLVETSAEKVGGADQSVNRPAPGARAETQRSLSQLDGAVGVAGH